MPQQRRKTHKASDAAGDNPGILPLELPPEGLASLGVELQGRPFASQDELNTFLASTIGELFGDGEEIAPPDSPLGKAQELVYDALESDDRIRRVRLAKKALKLSPDCADAWVLLSRDEAETPERAQELLEEAVRAGERAIGEAAFAENAGQFWLVPETRPYMRARLGLANLLLLLDERDEAIAHVRALLELNPNDNQGARYVLLSLFIEDEEDDAVWSLLDQYPDDGSAIWDYSRALWRFRADGDGRKARADLKKAVTTNPFVPDYLLGDEPMPAESPPFIGIGDDMEAQSYVLGGISGWLRVPGAIEWARAHAPLSGADRSSGPITLGPAFGPLVGR